MKKGKISQVKAEIRQKKGPFAVYVILRTIVVIAMVLSLIRGDWENLFACTLSLILFMAPAFISSSFGIELPSPLEIIILLFIFSASFLGEMRNYYIKYPAWDTMLHTLNGFLCGAVGFSMVDLLNQSDKIKFKLSPVYLAIVSFCFSMTVGTLWEFFEFACDIFLKTDMQKDFLLTSVSSVKLNELGENKAVILDNIRKVTVDGVALPVDGYLDIGLFDTMKDLFVNFIGAVVFSVLGYFYVKNRGKKGFIKFLIPKKKNNKTEEM